MSTILLLRIGASHPICRCHHDVDVEKDREKQDSVPFRSNTYPRVCVVGDDDGGPARTATPAGSICMKAKRRLYHVGSTVYCVKHEKLTSWRESELTHVNCYWEARQGVFFLHDPRPLLMRAPQS